MAFHNHQFDVIEISPDTPPPVVSSSSSSSSSSNAGISSTILVAIVVTAAVFFLLGLLSLVVRYFRQTPAQSIYDLEASRGSGNGPSDDARALRRQLQQLFHLHDSGLDHASLEALPIFYYRDIVCLDTRPRPSCFDCAVCLSGFLDDDRLRLLPGCGHAFHFNCIDAWLLSNTTCPICRSSLVESGAAQDEGSDSWNDEFVGEEDTRAGIGRRVFSVILGKFRRSETGEEGSGGCGLDGRRCYSMGSYQYVVGDLNMTVELSPGDGKLKAARNEEDKRRSRVDVSKIWPCSRSTNLPP